MDVGDESNYAMQFERNRRSVLDGRVAETVANHHSRSSYSPSSTSLSHDDHNRSSLVKLQKTPDELSRLRQAQHTYTADLQKCVRDTTACVTRFINAFDDARGRRSDDAERHGRAMKLWRRAGDDCTTVADRALPPLIEAIRATIMRPTSVNAVFELINAASEAVRPGVRLLLSVRQLLNEADDDVATISSLTSLVLPVAESLQRMRRAAQRALAACVEEGQSRDVVARDLASDSRRLRLTSSEDVRHRAVVPYRGCVDAGLGLSDDNDYRLTLVALESCDAAYRQIQGCGACLDQLASTSSDYWRRANLDYDDDFQVRLLNKAVQLCYVLGTSITRISKSAKDGYIDDFCESIRRFAGAVSRIIIIISQMADGADGSRLRNLCLSGRAIRHCASSLVTSARQIAYQRHYSTPYRAYADHSRALSRALTHLVRYLSSDYVDMPPIADVR